MRILFLGQQSLSSPSGLGRHWPLAKELVALGHSVRIVTLHHDWQRISQARFVRESVEVVYAGPMQVLKRDGEKHYYSPVRLLQVTTQAVLGLRRAVAVALSEGFEIVHLLKPQPVNGLSWFLTDRRRTHPRFFVDCDDYEAGFLQGRSQLLRRPVEWFERNTPRMARGVTVNTEATRIRLQSQGVPPSQMLYLPNGVDRKRFAKRDCPLEARLRKRYRLHAEPLVIYLGTLSTSSHDVDLLIQAFVHVQNQLPAARLLLVGTGPDRDTLAALAHAAGVGAGVTFAGVIDPVDVPSYLRIADVSVEPTRATSVAAGRFPLKIVESLAAGVPVVCGDVGDRSRILHLADGTVAGQVVEPGNAGVLARAILDVLTGPALRSTLRQNAHRRAQDFYWDQLAPSVLNFYQMSQPSA